MSVSENHCRAALRELARCIVVKVGSRILTQNGRVDLGQIESLAGQLARLVEQDRQVCLVSSGAVGTAMTLLDTDRPTGLGLLQAYAAIGQAELIHHYNRAFEKHGRRAAQVLLTIDDMNHRRRYLNLRNTIFSLFDLRAVPILNENDCVATEEISVTFGDNDRLAANVAMLVDADLLVILSDVDALYDRHPEDPDAQRVGFVERIDEGWLETTARGKSAGATEMATAGREATATRSFSKGGMLSKMQAARMASSAGIPAVIAGGRQPDILQSILAGESVGTLIPGSLATTSSRRRLSSRKRWIKGSADISGSIVIDAGAVLAIREQGRSLLPIGVTGVTGSFEAGDLVEVVDQQGKLVGKGISNFSNQDALRIQGCRTAEISGRLGRVTHEEMIHRDNLAVD